MNSENIKILIIEENESLVGLFRQLLIMNDFTNLTIRHPEIAESALKNEAFDLVILDLELDSEAEKFEIIYHISEESKIIILSFIDSIKHENDIRKKLARVDAYVRKFEFVENLIPCVKKVCG